MVYFSVLFPPSVNMTARPGLAEVPWHKATVNEGDCLYLPYEWLHQVGFGWPAGQVVCCVCDDDSLSCRFDPTTGTLVSMCGGFHLSMYMYMYEGLIIARYLNLYNWDIYPPSLTHKTSFNADECSPSHDIPDFAPIGDFQVVPEMQLKYDIPHKLAIQPEHLRNTYCSLSYSYRFVLKELASEDGTIRVQDFHRKINEVCRPFLTTCQRS